MSETFEALVIDAAGDGTTAQFRRIGLADLPDRDVLVRVTHSTVNYKDALALTGKGRIARRLPMVAGIDLAGEVVESRDPRWTAGDRVILDGFGLSETEWGAYAKFARVSGDWLMRQPAAFSPAEAMAIGTAGYTAALCVVALEGRGGTTPGKGDVVVSGASGGVGSVAVALMSKRGHRVVASSRRADQHDYLLSLGAAEVIDGATLSAPGKPLQKERWQAAVDTVGSTTLANILAQTAYGGAVAACGLAGGGDLPTSVMPFILRNVALLGVDSVMTPMAARIAAWDLLAQSLDTAHLAAITMAVEPMHRLPELAEALLAGRIRGRVVVEIGD